MTYLIYHDNFPILTQTATHNFNVMLFSLLILFNYYVTVITCDLNAFFTM